MELRQAYQVGLLESWDIGHIGRRLGFYLPDKSTGWANAEYVLAQIDAAEERNTDEAD